MSRAQVMIMQPAHLPPPPVSTLITPYPSIYLKFGDRQATATASSLNAAGLECKLGLPLVSPRVIGGDMPLQLDKTHSEELEIYSLLDAVYTLDHMTCDSVVVSCPSMEVGLVVNTSEDGSSRCLLGHVVL